MTAMSDRPVTDDLLREAREASEVAWTGGAQWVNSLLSRLADEVDRLRSERDEARSALEREKQLLARIAHLETKHAEVSEELRWMTAERNQALRGYQPVGTPNPVKPPPKKP
jgi:chromosome segregation ATPase